MEDFVTYELAVKLREKGFREDCIAYYHTDGELIYNSDEYRGGDYRSLLMSYNSLPKNPIGCEQIDAPTISQVLKWLREEKAISVEPCATPYNCWYYMIKCKGEIKATYMNNKYGTYELSALAGIEYVLDNLI